MKTAVKAVLGATALLVATGVAVTWPVLAEVMEDRSRCAEGYDLVAEALEPFDVLEARPPGTVAAGGRESSCDDDDHAVSVGQSYRPGPAYDEQGEIEPFYRALALRRGWRVEPAPDGAEEEPCLVRDVGKRQVTLALWFPPGGDYHVSVSTWPC